MKLSGKVNPGVNDGTQVVLNLTKEAQTMKEAAARTTAPPFMRRQVSARQYADRFQAMTPEQKQVEINSLGIDNVLNILRRTAPTHDAGLSPEVTPGSMEAPNA